MSADSNTPSKYVLEWNPRHRKWYVWTPPSWVDRWIFWVRIGDYIVATGRTREEALENASRNLASGWEPPSNAHTEVVSL